MYLVITTYSFDPDVPVEPFRTEESAKEYLKSTFEDEVKIDTEENEYETVSEISQDGWYAKITNILDDREDVTEFRIATL